MIFIKLFIKLINIMFFNLFLLFKFIKLYFIYCVTLINLFYKLLHNLGIFLFIIYLFFKKNK